MKLLPNVPTRPYLDGAVVARLIDGNWWIRAACQSAKPDLFFPISSTGRSVEQAAEAMAVQVHEPGGTRSSFRTDDRYLSAVEPEAGQRGGPATRGALAGARAVDSRSGRR